VFRVVELETLDLGLTPEGDFLNNRSARDTENLHQRYKTRDEAVTHVFEPRAAAEEQAEGAQDSDEEEPAAGNNSNSREDAQTNKRRKIRFRAPAAETSPAAGAEEQRNVQIYRQEGMSDAQFRTLQNRIKNRPVSSVNGTYEMHIARPIAGMKGHTAFLTFAVAPLLR
jgi:hypothetical protein